MIRWTTAGESHGPGLVVVLEGLPAGLALDEDLIRVDLARRQNPLGAGGRMKIETDRAQIVSGVLAGRTTGAPVALSIPNADHASWKGREVTPYTVARPGHADFAAVVKYGYDDIRPSLERASARETAARTAAGACCRALLKEFGIEVRGRVETIGTSTPGDTPEAVKMIEAVAAAGDTIGGVIAVEVDGLPPGLGSHVSSDRRLDARLAGAVMGIQAIKGVEIGGGFRLNRDDGGVTGGISDGSKLALRAAMKPIPTTRKPRTSIDMVTGEKRETVYERSDACPVPRAVVVVEAEVCRVIADALSEKLGGDSIEEMRARFEALPRDRRLNGVATVFWP